MKALIEFIHGKGQTQTSHSHHHGNVHAHTDTDHGSRMMQLLGFSHRIAQNSDWMSDYRNVSLIPVSSKTLLVLTLVIIAGIAHWLLFPGIAFGSIIAIVAAGHLAVFIVGAIAVSLFVRQQRTIVRRLVINAIPWKGTEQVLDVGCGTGLLINGCAQKLTTGKAIGVDLWQESVAGTSSTLMANARVEGVADKVEVQNMDARHLTFEDARFNVVVSSLALHHIGTERQDREQAVMQMIRVLAPGGYLSLVDINPMIDIAESVIAQAGLQIIKRQQTHFFRAITARKL